MDLAYRDWLAAKTRHEVYRAIEYIPFHHQADWQLASEGFLLTDYPPQPKQHYVHVRLPDESVVKRAVVPRPHGQAKILGELAAYKQGKSYGLAAWATGFSTIPQAAIHFIGLEYATSEPEFNYLLEFLVSERGMNMKWDKLHNDPRGGRMILWLRTGAKYEVKSWNQKEALKGKKITAYVYTEAYQLPGLEVYTSISQNLRQLQGWAVAATTPDRPWVGIFHKFGHGLDLEWHCTCGVDGTANPFTFKLEAMVRDCPDWSLLPVSVQKLAKAKNLQPGGLMTREGFSIAWLGRMGTYVGSVYEYQIGQRLCTPTTHPMFWNLPLEPGDESHAH